MFTADEWPRRGALGTLVASGLALIGLSKGTELRAAKKKKKKGKPNPPAKLALVPGTLVDFAIPTGGTNWEAASTCPTGTIGVTRDLQLNILRPTPAQAADTCWVLLDGPTDPVGWLAIVKCEGGATPDGSVTAFCLQQP